MLDIVHKNFAERSTEEQVLERQRVSDSICERFLTLIIETCDEALDRAIASRTKLQKGGRDFLAQSRTIKILTAYAINYFDNLQILAYLFYS